MTADPALQGALGIGLALVLALAVQHKLRERMAFRAALANYRLLPESLVGVAATVLVSAEIALVAALLTLSFIPGEGFRTAAGCCAGLFALYTAAIAINLARGRREFDCGCGGPGARQTLGGGLLVRNAVLIGLSGICALPWTSRPLLWLDGFTIVCGGLTLAVLYAAVDRALSNQAPLRVWRESI